MAKWFRATGSTSNTERFLKAVGKNNFMQRIESLANLGVTALALNTPVDSGATASSWSFEIEYDNSSLRINWVNNHTPNGFPVAIMLQYGHGTGTGGYVRGRDFINPTMQPVFDYIADQVWKEVQAL